MSEQQDWFDEEKPMDEMTVQEVEHVCKLFAQQKKRIEEIEEVLSQENEKLEKIKNKALSYLSHFKKSNYRSEFGMIVRSEILSVKVENKDEFAKFLKDKEIYEDFVTFNNKKVVGLCNEEIEIAQKEGREYNVPGVSKPQYIEKVSLRK
jgi:hypothetical protein